MVIPYITFAGDCNKALEFYKIVFNTEIQMSQPYGNYVPQGVSNAPSNLRDWILHAEMQICGATFWFADEIAEPVSQGNMVKLTLTVPTAQQAQGIYDALSAEDAHISLPPTKTFYSTFHAALIDKFGVSWNLVAEEAPSRQYK